MRIVTWNCCRGPASTKFAFLKRLKPTIAIVQECARPVGDDPRCVWFGDNPRQGIGVVASGEFRISPVKPRDVPRYTIPMNITGPVSFLLLAVWSQQDRPYRYVKGIIRAVDCYRDLIKAQPTVIVGDFNSNTIWDHKRPNDQNHSGLVRTLADLGLVSAYHHFYGEAHGAESRPTFYLLWEKRRPFHIDYCFIPKEWAPFLQSVEVGTYRGWSRKSDHRPLVVDVAFPGEGVSS